MNYNYRRHKKCYNCIKWLKNNYIKIIIGFIFVALSITTVILFVAGNEVSNDNNDNSNIINSTLSPTITYTSSPTNVLTYEPTFAPTLFPTIIYTPSPTPTPTFSPTPISSLRGNQLNATNDDNKSNDDLDVDVSVNIFYIILIGSVLGILFLIGLYKCIKNKCTNQSNQSSKLEFSSII